MYSPKISRWRQPIPYQNKQLSHTTLPSLAHYVNQRRKHITRILILDKYRGELITVHIRYILNNLSIFCLLHLQILLQFLLILKYTVVNPSTPEMILQLLKWSSNSWNDTSTSWHILLWILHSNWPDPAIHCCEHRSINMVLQSVDGSSRINSTNPILGDHLLYLLLDISDKDFILSPMPITYSSHHGEQFVASYMYNPSSPPHSYIIRPHTWVPHLGSGHLDIPHLGSGHLDIPHLGHLGHLGSGHLDIPHLEVGYQCTDTGYWKLPPNDKYGNQEMLFFGPGRTKNFKTEYPVLEKKQENRKTGRIFVFTKFQEKSHFHHFLKNTKFHTFVKNTIFEKIPIFVRTTKIAIFTFFTKIPKNTIFYKNTKNHKIPKIALFYHIVENRPK